ncbi:hypothetical protein [uncultured Flavobacterium sp.]|uniref:hypothetical protein n=1 Tax=uncultured Flavobacterium sp. TaxID=165435 RepID=UPI002930C348|nr:hypothetical protein [uncultured Flavobacterium sp.]
MSINHNRIKIADLEKNQPYKILTTNQNGELEFTNINDIKIDNYNALDYTLQGKALDARQGKALKDLIDNINALLASDNVNLNTLQELVDAIEVVQNSLNTLLVNDLTIGGATKALTAEMGKQLQNNKVDKVTGKSLLSDTEITRLGTLSNYTHPSNHPPAIIIQDSSNRFVTDAEKTNWNNKQSVFAGISNYITKSINATTLGVSRLFDNGTFFGIGTSNTPTKDVTLGNQINREIGIEQSNNITAGRHLVLSAGRTINYVENSNFLPISDTGSIANQAVIGLQNGDIYASNGNTLYIQYGADGLFIPQTSSNNIGASGFTTNNSNDVWACTAYGSIYKKTANTSTWLSTGAPTKFWRDISLHPNGNIYATETTTNAIWVQTNGVGSWINLGVDSSLLWYGIECHPNGDVYASDINTGSLYKQTSGIGSFNFIGGITSNRQITTDASGNIYVYNNSGIFVQINATGPWISAGNASINAFSLGKAANGNVYAGSYNSLLYVKQNNGTGNFNLNGGTLKLKSGTGKGTGQSRLEFITGQKLASGTDMQIETLREYIDENGYHIHTSMPTYPDNTAALIGGLPIGCEYKTTTGQRMIVY